MYHNSKGNKPDISEDFSSEEIEILRVLAHERASFLQPEEDASSDSEPEDN
ncbi:MAG: hypothetical protein ACI4BB_09375 [Coprococcus sp.]